MECLKTIDVRQWNILKEYFKNYNNIEYIHSTRVNIAPTYYVDVAHEADNQKDVLIEIGNYYNILLICYWFPYRGGSSSPR